jgi:ATP-binding cassette, subfamily G (WHITE), eye pigment precursor transporter
MVNDMLKNMSLVDCADDMIGGGLIRGIPGEQRKRTSVAIELVTNPKLVFLDEPTTGLDSSSALSCVRLLRSVARRGATILATIHQPSSEVFALFDDFILMKDGRIMHQGPVELVHASFMKYGYPIPVFSVCMCVSVCECECESSKRVNG